MSTRATLTQERPAGRRADMPAPGRGLAADPHHDHLLERLHNLRSILPVLATELASARRQAAQLRVENRRLAEQLRRLQDDALARASASARRRLGSRTPQNPPGPGVRASR